MAVYYRIHCSDTVQNEKWSYGIHEGQMQIYVGYGVCLVLA